MRHSIYISHAWGGESDQIVSAIDKRFEKEGIEVILDKKNLGYRESITSFMQNLGRAEAIILVISNKYLHSEYCMFELLQIYENKDMLDRIFPIVLDEVEISKSTDRIQLVKYWEEQVNTLENQIRQLSSINNIEGITDDLNLYHRVRNEIAKLTTILSDLNTLNVNRHRETDFSELLQAVKQKIHFNQPHLSAPFSKDTKIIATGHLIDAATRASIIGLGRTDNEQFEDQVKTKSKAGLLLFMEKYQLILIPIVVFALGFVIIQSSNKSLTTALNDEVHRFDAVQPTVENKVLHDGTIISDTLQQKEVDSHTKIENSSSSVKTTKTSSYNHKKTATAPDTDDNIHHQKEVVSTLENTALQPIEATATTKPSSQPDKFSTVNKTPTTTPRTIYFDTKRFTAHLKREITSESVATGTIVYLVSDDALYQGKDLIVASGATVRALVTAAKTSPSGHELAIQLQDVQAVNGQWLQVDYPLINEKKKSKVIFSPDNPVKNIKLIHSSISIFQ